MCWAYGDEPIPSTPGMQKKQPRTYGASQGAVGRKSTPRTKRLAEARHTAKKIHTLASGRRSKVLVTRASLQTGDIYACELSPLSMREIAVLRVALPLR